MASMRTVDGLADHSQTDTYSIHSKTFSRFGGYGLLILKESDQISG
jgi:hypothetical protein